MPHAWTERQFVGGAVALDFANTVCYRGDPRRSFDKIDTAAELRAFADAAMRFSDAAGGLTMRGVGDPVTLALCREIRERTDALFRPVAAGKSPSADALRAILRIHADLLDGHPLRAEAAGIGVDPDSRPPLPLVLTQSALRLAGSSQIGRLRICPNCAWLFVDRSKNSSRVWCDMLTCGNRAKAERHAKRWRIHA